MKVIVWPATLRSAVEERQPGSDWRKGTIDPLLGAVKRNRGLLQNPNALWKAAAQAFPANHIRDIDGLLEIQRAGLQPAFARGRCVP